MISKLRHKLGVSSIMAVVYLCIYILVIGAILFSAVIDWWLPIVIIPSLIFIYIFSDGVVSVIKVVNKMNGIIIEDIFFKVYDEKNQIR